MHLASKVRRFLPILVLMAPVASAQTDMHGYVEGSAGPTFGNQSSGNYGGQVGFDVAPNVQWFVDFNYSHNIMNSTLLNNVTAAIGSYVPPGGQPASTIQESGYSYSGGIRFRAARNGLQPYVQVRAGLIHLALSIRDAAGNDTTQRYTADSLNTGGTTTIAPLGGSFTNAGDVSASKFLAGFGGGVEIPAVGHVLVDVGYEYSRPFSTTTTFNINRVYFAVGYKF
jgi:opacity protein-like surface antigen